MLSLLPAGGNISGNAGSTVGWGFTFTNDSSYAVITGSQFCDAASAPLPNICLPPSPNLGTYSDYAGVQFLVAGPAPESTTITQALDSTAQTGIGSFAINSSATGTVNGLIVLTYDLFSVSPNDPSFDPTVDAISFGNFLTEAASLTVVPATAVPEPSTILLLMPAVGFIARKLRRSHRLEN